MPTNLETDNTLEYQFYPNNVGFIEFRVKASNDAHIALSTASAEATPMYEVFLGGWNNTKSIIRKNRTKPDVCEAETESILHPGEYRGFWIRWCDGNISVGREGEASPFLNWNDSEVVPIEYVGFSTGWGATGSWIIEGVQDNAIPQPKCDGSACWVAAVNGELPPRAFVGGEDNGEPVYVIRASFNGALIPGKLLTSHGTAYVPWGGQENAVSQYDVLCDFSGDWIACTDSNIPPNALPAGQSEEGDTLYVGRVVHDGALTVGKVQPNHGVIYISYGGEELSFNNYEVLVSK